MKDEALESYLRISVNHTIKKSSSNADYGHWPLDPPCIKDSFSEKIPESNPGQ